MKHVQKHPYLPSYAMFILVAVLVALAPTAKAIVTWANSINTNNVVTITNAAYGAVGDGVTTNTTAIQNAINAAANGGFTNGWGGVVRIPPGVFLCGPLALKNNVGLQFDTNAVLRMLPYGSWPGAPYSSTPASFISGSSGQTNIAVTGAGAIDGQGSAWWTAYNADNTIKRPNAITLSSCSRVLLQGFTISNSPSPHIAIKGNNAGNVTFLGITLRSPATSPNTDGVDFAETNGLFQDCVIDDGDDNIAIGSSAGLARDILVTNCTFLNGHGCSIGSFTSSGVSNLTVINCTFNGTANGIRLKSQRDRGGLIQNLNYFNLTMTNVDWPFLIYSYYEFGLGTISPANSAYAAGVAATDTNNAVTSTWPVWRNITFSNITAYATGARPALMLWGLPQLDISNVVFQRVTLSANRIAEIFNVRGVQFIDSRLNFPAGTNGFDLFNANVIITNSAPTNALFLFGGTMTNAYGDTNVLGNSLSFYTALGTLKNTNAFDDGPLTLAASTFTVSNSFTLPPTAVINFIPGTNATTLVVKGNLTLGGTNNIYAGAGFTNGTYTLMTYTGTLGGSAPALGVVPPGYNCSISASTPGQVNLVVTQPAPPAPTNLTATASNLLINLNWNAVSGATTYNLKRGTANGGPYPTVVSGLPATNYPDANVTNTVSYFYVVTAVNAGGESANSIQASAAPLPSNQPTNITTQIAGGQLELNWPQDHLGWRLQIQTNDLSSGLGANWTTVPNSTNFNSFNLFASPTNGSVFLRLVYP